MKQLNFEELMKLWKDHPEQAEQYRLDVIEELINGLPEYKQQHARILQHRIDSDLEHFIHPIARMNRVGELMWGSFLDLKDSLNGEVPENTINSNLLDKPVLKSI